MPKSILVCDDESGLRQVLVSLLKPMGFTIYEAEDGATAISTLKSQKPFGDVETAVGAIKRGPFDYLSKPFRVDDVKSGTADTETSKIYEHAMDSYLTVKNIWTAGDGSSQIYRHNIKNLEKILF